MSREIINPGSTSPMAENVRRALHGNSWIRVLRVVILLACMGIASAVRAASPPPTLTITGPAFVGAGTTTAQYIANVDGVALAPGDSKVWWLIPETAIASIGSTTGIATGIAEGSATVRFDYLWNGEWWSGSRQLPSYPITVTPEGQPVPPTLTISGPASVGVGSTGQYTAYVDGVALASGDAKVWWVISETTIASIGSTTGIATGIAEGSATVRFDYLWNGTWWSSGTIPMPSKAITVTGSGGPTPPTLTISGPASVGVGFTSQYIANVDGVALNPGDPNVWWIIPETAIASIGSTTGIATGIAEGSATVRFDYLWNGKWWSSGTIAMPSLPITVIRSNEPIPPTLTISGPNFVGAGLTGQYIAYTNGVALAAGDANVWWNIPETGIASIGSTTGIATGIAAGAATVRFDYLWNGNWWSSGTRPMPSKAITVTPEGEPVPPTLTISGPTTLEAGETGEYIAYVDGVALEPGDANVWWVLSETGTASIGSRTGVATAIGAGSAKVRFDYLWNGVWWSASRDLPSYSITVTGSELPPMPTLTISGPAIVGIDGTAQYTAYTNGVALAPGDASVWWVISEVGVASMGSTTGIATGVSEGAANVRFDFLWAGKWLSSFGQMPSYPINVGYTVNISIAGNVASLSWPYSGFVLQENSDIGNLPGWADVQGGGVSPVDITVSSTGAARFYRLKKSP
jgi:hypothetical protein